MYVGNEAWAPPERISVSEWADAHRTLTPKQSAEPGPFRTERNPAVREIQDAFGDPRLRCVIVQKAAQMGVSEAMRNALGSWIDLDPGPVLWVFPSKESAERTSKKFLWPLVRTTPRLAVQATGRYDIQRHEIEFSHCTVFLGWSGSPTALASVPVRYVGLDEVDKYPPWSGMESDPVALAIARTRTFPRRKILMVSTPTTKLGAIYQAVESCPDRRRWWTPCASCGEYQVFGWSQVRWAGKAEGETQAAHAARVRSQGLAWLECRQCGERVSERDRQLSLHRGEWRQEEPCPPSDEVAYRLDALASPWSTLAGLASKWLAAQGRREKVQEFVNQELGLPFEDELTRVEAGIYRAKAAAGHEHRLVPAWAGVVLATVDTQRDHFWWCVRAWGANFRSRLLDFGRCGTFADLKRLILQARFPIEGSELEFQVGLVLIDSGGGGQDLEVDGSRTDEVYRWARLDPRVRPIRGAGGRTKPARHITCSRISYQPPGTRIAYEVELWIVDADHYKDILTARVRSEEALWELYDTPGEEYCRQMAAEHRVIVREGNVERVRWQPISRTAPNHCWDLEVYQCAAADLARVDTIPEEGRLRRQRNERAAPPRRERRDQRWVDGSGWSW